MNRKLKALDDSSSSDESEYDDEDDGCQLNVLESLRNF